VSALADHTFRDAIQGREFEIIEFAVGVLLCRSQAFQGVEFAFEDVGLIYFVCEDDELFFCGE
jgi:ethanolamine utilization protein EutA (predicted chaperonin)